tara:strand:+ start:140 stop:862 length:723 start_codon:yes stop_codon:yes gene_type:complete
MKKKNGIQFKFKKIDKENYNLNKNSSPKKSKKLNYKNKLILKPWGFETLINNTKKTAYWFLFIKKNSETSMHCHSNKKTVLLVLDGKIRFKTLNNTFQLKKNNYVIINKKVFHQTRSISNKPSIVLEIESPVDKGDLLRLYDKYNRVGKGYEKRENKNKTLKKLLYKNIYKNIKFLDFNKNLFEEVGLKYLMLTSGKKFNLKNVNKKELYLSNRKSSKKADIIALKNGTKFDYSILRKVN